MRYLTKSRFKLGLECPNKLTENFNEEIEENDFLKALADGGFQAEELARLHYKNGILIEDKNHSISSIKTNKELSKDNCVIYEAAFLYKKLFVRTDILIKSGNSLKIIEVKAKSFNSEIENTFITSSGQIKSSWKSYLFDLAFQKFVVKKCFPVYKVEAFFMLADKSKKASIDGLNQLFQICDINTRTGVNVKVNSLEEIGSSVMQELDVTYLINNIINERIHLVHEMSFNELVSNFSNLYVHNKNINWKDYNGHVCKNCWENQFNISENDSFRPNIYELWQFRKHKQLFTNNLFFLDQLKSSDFEDSRVGPLSVKARQWIQIQKRVKQSKGHKVECFLDTNNLKSEMQSWEFPFHFIDFETCTSALPFTKGRRPYEQVAFQFSHHTISVDGKIEHKSEYINVEPGVFPNYDFVRHLKQSLENDNGSIFRYASHENSVLVSIYNQLDESSEHDKFELMNFIRTITNKKENNEYLWRGKRDMIDMCELVKKFFYHPNMRGSNSIKVVLPTIIEISKFIQKKYSKPIGDINITSMNFFDNHIWIKDNFSDLYESLPNPDYSNIEDTIGKINSLNSGGDALIAYGKIQYVDMSDKEREIIKKSLLKYCELDTLAMVMIMEAFFDWKN